ncbi:MAG TPA: hypothetical protein DCE08_03395 [Ruminococcaceae bacterium]|nr:hypothetical protein [Oscillospiraceae bacterium]
MPNTNRITLVCVTDQRKCERIIRAARKIADISDSDLYVLNVSHPEITRQDTDSLQYLFDVSKEHNAVMHVVYSENPARVLGQFIKEHKITTVVTGLPQGEDSILYRLIARFHSTDFFAVDYDGTALRLPFPSAVKKEA